MARRKKEQEYRSLRNINNSFKKVIIVKNDAKPFYTSEGFLRISLLDFLLDINSLDFINVKVVVFYYCYRGFKLF